MKFIVIAFLLSNPLAASDEDSFLIRGATIHPVASAACFSVVSSSSAL